MKIIGFKHGKVMTKYLVDFETVWKPFKFVVIYHDSESGYFNKHITKLNHCVAFDIYQLMKSWYNEVKF